MWSLISTGVPGVQAGSQPAAAVGQDERRAARRRRRCGRRGRRRARRGPRRSACGARRRGPAGRSRRCAPTGSCPRAPRPRRRGTRAARVIGTSASVSPSSVAGRRPARAQDERDVVALGAGQLRDAGRGRARDVLRVGAAGRRGRGRRWSRRGDYAAGRDRVRAAGAMSHRARRAGSAAPRRSRRAPRRPRRRPRACRGSGRDGRPPSYASST